MPKSSAPCWCKTAGCDGLHVSYRRRRMHREQDLRRRAQQPYKRPDPNLLSVAPNEVMPHAVTEPLLPSWQPPIEPFPDLSHFPSPSSSSAVEQEMLDHGTMSMADLHLDVPLPSLPPGLHSGDMLQECVDHFEVHNAITRTNATTLTATVAHSTPPLTPLEKQLQRQYEREMEHIQSQTEGVSISGLPPCDDDTFLPAIPVLPAPSSTLR